MGKIHYKWPFSIATLVYQRVSIINWYFGVPRLDKPRSTEKCAEGLPAGRAAIKFRSASLVVSLGEETNCHSFGVMAVQHIYLNSHMRFKLIFLQMSQLIMMRILKFVLYTTAFCPVMQCEFDRRYRANCVHDVSANDMNLRCVQ